MKLRSIAEARRGKFAYYLACASLSESGAGWRADLVSEPVIVTQKQTDGTEKRIRVMKHRVDMTNGKERLSFKVGKGAGGFPVFTDDRPTKTGAAQVTNRGPLPGEQYAKAGTADKMTPTAWANEVERLIGPAGVGQIFMALVKAGFKAG